MSDQAADDRIVRLKLDFLAWLARRPRTYADAMDAWRSSCPRHPVWEDALADGLIQIQPGGPGVTMNQSRVILTPRGRAVLDEAATGKAPAT